MAAKKWDRALAEAKRLARDVPGLTGIDYGWAYRAGSRRRQHCIRFHVARKLPESELARHNLLPKEISGIPTDVVVGRYALHGNPRASIDPLQPGVSIGNLNRTSTGTLGAIVTDPATGKRGLLSIWHVFCGGTGAQPGDTICQPGPFHAGSQLARPVGLLERWLDLASGLDAAFAFLNPAAPFDPTVFDLSLQVAGIESPTLGLRVVKCGATSDATSAVVDGLDGSFAVDYSQLGDQSRWMDGIHLVREPGPGPDEISLRGDSGALWINPVTKNAVGLHFSGEDNLGPLAEYALAHPIARVLQQVNVTLP